jgi:hypothetical protein
MKSIVPITSKNSGNNTGFKPPETIGDPTSAANFDTEFTSEVVS